jgi:hypothetical protein
MSERDSHSAADAPLSSIGAPPGMERPIAIANAAKGNKRGGFQNKVETAMLGLLVVGGATAALTHESDTTTEHASDPEAACEQVPEGVAAESRYRAACEEFVDACEEQAGVNERLMTLDREGPRGINAGQVPGLEERRQALRKLMFEALDGMHMRTVDGKRRERITCENEGRNAYSPRVQRTFPRRRT